LKTIFFGRDPFVYHLDNLLLHLAVVAFIFWLGLRLGLSALGSGAAALLFGIHPLHVESVAWVTERKDVLYSFFYMAALLSYSRYLDFTKSTPSIQNKKLTRFLILTVLFGILSMLAKPMALSLPLILLLLDWLHKRKIDGSAIVEKVPLVLGIIGITWVTYATHARIPGKGIIEGMLIWSWTLIFYLRQFVLPIVLVPVYQLPKPIVFFNPEYFMPVIIFCLLIIAVIRFRKHRWFIFSVAFYLFSIFFLLRYDEGKDLNIVADRFMYLPSLGFCFLCGYGFQRLWGWGNRRIALPAMTLVVIFVILLAVKTSQQCRIWHDSISLWKHQLQYYPNEPVALNNLAAALREKEEFKEAEAIYSKVIRIQSDGTPIDLSDEAIFNIRKVDYLIGLYRRAITSNPDFIDSYYHLGNLLKDIGRVSDAVYFYKETLKFDHKRKDVHFSLGELYQKVGDHKQAIYAYGQTLLLNSDDEDVYVEVISAYNRALKEDSTNALYIKTRRKVMDSFTRMISNKPPRATSFFNLGYLYNGMNDRSRAISAYQMVLDINPNHNNAIYNLGNIYRDQGRLSKALAMYRRTVKLNTRNSDAYLNMGSIYERQGKQKQARESFQKAIKVDSQNSRAYFNLGYIDEQEGNLRKAAELYQKSINLDPKKKEAYYNLGNIYARLRKNSQAISSYLKAVQIDYRYMDALINLSTLSFKENDFVNAVKYCDEAILLGYKAPQGYLNALAPYRARRK